MSDEAITGLEAEIQEVLELGRSLSDDEWALPSACDGWSVKDLYSHMGCLWHGLVDPEASPLPTFSDPEAENEIPVEKRRAWTNKEVFAEYEEFADGALGVLKSLQAPEARDNPFPLGVLGTFPTHIVADAFCFDHLAHLNEDLIAPLGPLDRKRVPMDEARMIGTMNWMTGGLGLGPWKAAMIPALSSPIVIKLTGPGGGAWSVSKSAAGDAVDVVGGASDGDGAAVVHSTTDMFMSWATKRRDWRRCGVRITGDEALAAAVLDGINFI